MEAIANLLKLDPATLLLIIGVLCTACNLVGRHIPDDAVGLLGWVRDICKVVGLYAPNRVATGITVNDIARNIVTQSSPEVVAAAEQAGTLIPDVIEDIVDQPVKEVFTKYMQNRELDPDPDK